MGSCSAAVSCILLRSSIGAGVGSGINALSHWFQVGSASGQGYVLKSEAAMPGQHWLPLHEVELPSAHGVNALPHWFQSGSASGQGYVLKSEAAVPGQHWLPLHEVELPSAHCTRAWKMGSCSAAVSCILFRSSIGAGVGS